jgi:hypothetical protein
MIHGWKPFDRLALPFSMASSIPAKFVAGSPVRTVAVRSPSSRTRAGCAALVVPMRGNLVKARGRRHYRGAGREPRTGGGRQILAIDKGRACAISRRSSIDGHRRWERRNGPRRVIRPPVDEFDVYNSRARADPRAHSSGREPRPRDTRTTTSDALCIPKGPGGKTGLGGCMGMTLDPNGTSFPCWRTAWGTARRESRGERGREVLLHNEGATPDPSLDIAHAKLRPTRGVRSRGDPSRRR